MVRNPKIDSILNEVLQGLESSQAIPLTPIVRKAARVAQFYGEIEYQVLFQMHLGGFDKQSGIEAETLKLYQGLKEPKWNPGLAFIADRSFRKGGVQTVPLEQLETIYQGIRSELDALRRSHGPPDLIVGATEDEYELSSMFTRIRNRVGNFALALEKKYAAALPSDSMGDPSPESADIEQIEPIKKIFIGHGGSLVWHQLRDFLQNRLNLPCEEFNREPTAGRQTIERLQEMLDNSIFAFLVMTAEEEHADMTLHPKENVIHEAGLFQAKLGFHRAIILLEEGCAEFSNIQGLTQIRFPKGNIMAKSE